MIVGYDESGVGEIYGPMYGVAVAVNNSVYGRLVSLNLPDPKLMSLSRVCKILKQFKGTYQSCVIRVPVSTIDKTNMNEVKLVACRLAIKRLMQRVPDVTSVTIDCPWSQKDAFKSRILPGLPPADYRIMHKADSVDAAVKLASLVARFKYRAQWLKLCEAYGEIGSGNLADPVTVTYCKGNRLAPFIRQKWRVK